MPNNINRLLSYKWFEWLCVCLLGIGIIAFHFHYLLFGDISREMWGISISADPMSTLAYTNDTVWEMTHGCLRQNALSSFPFGGKGTPPFSHFLSLPSQLFTLLYILSHQLILSYNISIILMFFINYVMTYLAFRLLLKDKWAAILPAVLISFSAYAYARSWAHLTMMVLFTYPWFLYAFTKLQETKRIRFAVLAGICFGINVINSPYYGYFTIWMAVAIIFAYILVDPKRYLSSDLIKVNALCAAIALISATPFVYDYFIVAPADFSSSYGKVSFGQDLEQIRSASARPSDYVLPNVNNDFFGEYTAKLITEPINLRHRYSDELPIYIGALPALFLFLTVLFVLLRRDQWAQRAKSTNTALFWSLIMVMIVSFFISLPDRINIFGVGVPMPNEWLRQIMPFRSYSRFALVFLTALSALISMIVVRSKHRKIIISAMILGCIFESAPKKWLLPADYDHGYIKFLSERPERVIMRFEAQNVQLRRAVDLERMLAKKQSINGLINNLYGFTEVAGLNDKSPINLGHLAQMGVELLIITGHYTPGTKNAPYAYKIAEFADSGVEIWKLKPGPDERITELFKPYVEAARVNPCQITSGAEVRATNAKFVEYLGT